MLREENLCTGAYEPGIDRPVHSTDTPSVASACPEPLHSTAQSKFSILPQFKHNILAVCLL